VLEAVQQRLDANPQAMRLRRETVEHPFGTLKMRVGATQFLMKRLPKAATEMTLHVLAYNLTRVVQALVAAMRTCLARAVPDSVQHSHRRSPKRLYSAHQHHSPGGQRKPLQVVLRRKAIPPPPSTLPVFSQAKAH
jgi:hypothetical protein